MLLNADACEDTVFVILTFCAHCDTHILIDRRSQWVRCRSSSTESNRVSVKVIVSFLRMSVLLFVCEPRGDAMRKHDPAFLC